MPAFDKAFADLTSWRKVAVSGPDSITWLNDLVSADVSGLAPNLACRSLLLSPTGRIRAEFTVSVPGGTVVLLQDPAQPNPIDALLAPYVLSSDVTLEDRTEELCLFAFPGRSRPPDPPGTAVSAPSCLGPGVDLLALAEDHDHLLRSFSKAFTELGEDGREAWRIAAGVPRFGVDASPEDLPQEAGLADAVAFHKGCYLGQEAVAKVRNLGHPRRLLMHLATEAEVSRGAPLLVGGREAGQVTGSTRTGERTFLLARVRWDAREGPFLTVDGIPLEPVAAA